MNHYFCLGDNFLLDFVVGHVFLCQFLVKISPLLDFHGNYDLSNSLVSFSASTGLAGLENSDLHIEHM
jgi:hypothetical protein